MKKTFYKEAKQDLMNKLIFRKISGKLAIFLSKFNIAPTSLTILAFLAGITAVVFIIYGQLILGGAFVLLSHIIDQTDGDLARLKRMESKAGDFLDDTFDRILDALFIFAISFALYAQTLNPLSWAYGFIAVTAVFMTFTIGLSIKKPERTFGSVEKDFLKNKPSYLLLGRGIRNFLIFAGLVLNQLLPLLLFFVFIQNIYWIVGAMLAYREKSKQK